MRELQEIMEGKAAGRTGSRYLHADFVSDGSYRPTQIGGYVTKTPSMMADPSAENKQLLGDMASKLAKGKPPARAPEPTDFRF